MYHATSLKYGYVSNCSGEMRNSYLVCPEVSDCPTLVFVFYLGLKRLITVRYLCLYILRFKTQMLKTITGFKFSINWHDFSASTWCCLNNEPILKHDGRNATWYCKCIWTSLLKESRGKVINLVSLKKIQNTTRKNNRLDTMGWDQGSKRCKHSLSTCCISFLSIVFIR